MRSVVLAAFFAVSVAASGQTPAPAPFEVSVAVSRAPTVGGSVGGETSGNAPQVVVALDASGAVARRGPVDVRLGGVLRVAATSFIEDVPMQAAAAQHVAGYVAVGLADEWGGRAEARAGVSVDLGPDYLDGDVGGASYTSDTQHALWLGGGYAWEAEGVTLFAGAETFLTRRRSMSLPLTTPDDPDGSDATFSFFSDFGDALNAHVGASRRAGPLDVALTLYRSSRTRAFYEVVGQIGPPLRRPGAHVLSLVPAVAYRAESGLGVEVAMRAPGVSINEHAVHGIPLVVRRTRVGAVPLSLRVDYRW